MITLRTLFAFLFLCGAVHAQDRLTQLMKQFTEAPGPPGAEGPVRKLFAESARPFADKISYDGLGSVIGLTDSSGNLVNNYSYDAFGRLLSSTQAVTNVFQYASGYLTTANVFTYATGMRMSSSRSAFSGLKPNTLPMSEAVMLAIEPSSNNARS